MKRKLIITALLVIMLAALMTGITAYAEEPAGEAAPVTAEEASEPAGELPAGTIPPVEEIISEEPAAEETPATETPVVETPAEETPAVETPAAETAAQESLSYVVTISDVNGNSVDVTGGAETAIAEVLRNLGYEIGEDTIIEVDPESVDTNVINVTETANGPVLTDNGPFGRAARNMIVYVNGVAIELELVDPTKISGNMTAQQVQDAFGTDASNPLNVILEDNVTLTDNATITLKAGVHDLYLNGKTLNACAYADKCMFVIGEGVTLNVYGGADSTNAGNGKIDGSLSYISNIFDLRTGGTLNIYNGTFDTHLEGCIAQVNGGEMNLSGGTISGNRGITVKSGELIVTGATIKCDSSIFVSGGNVSICGGNIIAGSLGEAIAVYGGTLDITNGNVYGISVSKGNVNISGGNISSNTHHSLYTVGGTTTITGGTFNGTDVYNSNGTLNIIGGSFNSRLNHKYGTFKIAGGTFSTDPSAYLLSTDFEAVENGGKWTVGLKSGATAKAIVIDGNSNMTSVDADGFSAAFQNDGKIIMLDDIKVNATVVSGKTVTLDLNGKTLTAEKAADTVITNNGTLTLTDSAGGGKVTGGAKGVEQNGTMTLAGKAEISGNTANLYLPANKTITVADGFSGKVGVTTASVPAAVTSISTADYSACFFADNSTDYYIFDAVTGNDHQVQLAAKIQLTVTGTTADGKTYDGNTTAEAHIGSVAGKVEGDDVTVEIDSATFSDKNAGNGKDVTVVYKLSGTKAGNYIVPVKDTTIADISPRQLTVTDTAADDKKYDGTTAAVAHVGTVGGIVEGDDVTVEINTAEFEDKDAGSSIRVDVSYKLSGEKAGNYAVPVNDTTSADITKRSVTLTSGSAEKAYDGRELTCSEVTVSGDGFVAGEYTESVTTGSQTEIGTSENTFFYVVEYGVFKADNYDIETVFGTLTVKPAPTQTAVDAVINIKVIQKTELNAAQQQEAESLEAKAKIVNILRVTKNGSASGPAGQNIVFGTALFQGYEASALHVWYLAEDGTLTEQEFTVNAYGEIVIANGNLGVYVITA